LVKRWKSVAKNETSRHRDGGKRGNKKSVVMRCWSFRRIGRRRRGDVDFHGAKGRQSDVSECTHQRGV